MKMIYANEVQEELRRLGVTGIQDAGIARWWMETKYEELIKSGNYALRDTRKGLEGDRTYQIRLVEKKKGVETKRRLKLQPTFPFLTFSARSHPKHHEQTIIEVNVSARGLRAYNFESTQV